MEILDQIFLKNFTIDCIIGVEAHERKQSRKVLLNIMLSADTRRAAKSDQIEDTVNYAAVYTSITSHVRGKEYRLLETLAEDIARLCLAYTGVRSVQVRAEKWRMLQGVETVGVEIVRKK